MSRLSVTDPLCVCGHTMLLHDEALRHSAVKDAPLPLCACLLNRTDVALANLAEVAGWGERVVGAIAAFPFTQTPPALYILYREGATLLGEAVKESH